jgi:hypothetical protein
MEIDPDKPYVIFTIVSPLESQEQLDKLKEDFISRAGKVALSAGIVTAAQLELFRIVGNEIEIEPEPWITDEEWINHYKFVFMSEYPNSPPGSWVKPFLGEFAEFLPSEKKVIDKNGKVIKIDRSATRKLIELETKPKINRISGPMRRKFLHSIGRTLVTTENE